jgi:asparagine synthase (glutamine-hydrolysing)
MTFIAIFHSDAAPIDTSVAPLNAAQKIKVLGRSRQAAFSTVATVANVCGRLESFDGHNWLIGRVRLDGRSDLVTALGMSPQHGPQAISDSELCLAAYARWGENFLGALAGDFCFVLWDEAKQTMLCARDQLGVRPLFAAQVGSRWLISDSLCRFSSVRALTGKLDDFWIADFLMFGFGMEHDRTVFSAVKRVPAGHFLKLTEGRCDLRRYWKLELGQPLHFTDSRRYLEEFHWRLSRAVADRLPQGPVGILMSGGLDSPTLAAKAVEVSGEPSLVRAETHYFRSLIPDDEEQFSKLVAAKLAIQHNLIAVDELSYDPGWYNSGNSLVEPHLAITRTPGHEVTWGAMREKASVWLYGEGPDNAMTFEWRSYLRWLLIHGKCARLANAGFDYLRTKTAKEWLRTLNLTRRNKAPSSERTVPRWVNATLAKETDLCARVSTTIQMNSFSHEWRPRAVTSFTSTNWPHLLESCDAASARASVELRHPYLDLRFLGFLLAVPPIPWARQKHLIRKAMLGILPTEVLTRQKTPLRQDPLALLLRQHSLPDITHESPVTRFVNRAELLSLGSSNSEMYQRLRVHVLDYWLRQHGYF